MERNSGRNIILKFLSCCFLVCFSLIVTEKCDAKVFYCDSHDIPKELNGEFIAVYDKEKDETVYYDKEELDKFPKISKEMLSPLPPEYPLDINNIAWLK